jgi:hypothetical protein
MILERTALWLSLPALAGVTSLASCATRFCGRTQPSTNDGGPRHLAVRAHAIGAWLIMAARWGEKNRALAVILCERPIVPTLPRSLAGVAAKALPGPILVTRHARSVLGSQHRSLCSRPITS